MGIKEKIEKFPNVPGVYLMKDKDGRVIYIGKARSLRKRVASYFSSSRDEFTKTALLVDEIRDIDYIPCSSEEDALLLEASLVKEHKPKYNVELKDDKSYPFLKLTQDEFPRIYIGRGRGETDIRYFGPYTDVELLRKALTIIRQIFGLRSCKSLPRHVCLDYHIGLCVAPCGGKVTRRNYNEAAAELVMFLEGRRNELLDKLKDKMANFARRRRFEEAACVRDRIEALAKVVAGHKRFAGITALEELKSVLNLARLPRRIEIFDISNIMGAMSAGSMASFFNGEPNKDGYRRFRIRSRGINDYEMIREVVRRRYTRVKDERLPYPDLIIIDGGRGHLNTALEELEELGLAKLQVIAIAKRKEEIFLKDSKSPICLPRSSGALKLLQRMRNEAHRFAISYHKKLRKWRMLGEKS